MDTSHKLKQMKRNPKTLYSFQRSEFKTPPSAFLVAVSQ